MEVQWGAEETVQIYHQGTLIATHPRVSGHHQRCVQPAHEVMLRPAGHSPGARQSDTGVDPTRWTEELPKVAIRALAIYEALLGPEVTHDSSTAPCIFTR